MNLRSIAFSIVQNFGVSQLQAMTCSSQTPISDYFSEYRLGNLLSLDFAFSATLAT